MSEKEQLRKALKEKRKSLSAAEVDEKSSVAAKIFLESDVYKKASTIMLYMPIQNEVDTSRIIDRAFMDKKQLVFPVTDRKNGVITPYLAEDKTEFKKGAFSVPEPALRKEISFEEIDVILVPGIVFDKSGNRIGFGKGCYDLFLCKCNALKTGVCYEFQLFDKIPADEHDIKMDYILTEAGFRVIE